MKLFEVPDAPACMPDAPARISARHAKTWRDYEWATVWPFVLLHVLVLGVLWTGMSASTWVLCAVLYFVRMFGVTGVYHRYFSHRTYKTSRPMQFLLAFLAETSSQRGALWWAAHHRDHHKYSDTERDPHSPVVHGFLHAHMGWLYDRNSDTNWARVKDFARYPELVALDKLWLVPPTLLGFAVWAIWGWEGLFGGFMLSTVLLWHGTFAINSLAHVWGKRRYATEDQSRNNWWLAILTMGEGWHNNHHHYMGSTRQGFFWWEIDLSYYVLKAMSWVGLVWDLREPPARVYAKPEPAEPPSQAAA